MPTINTTEAVAEKLGTSVRRVQQLAEELNLPRLGRQFIITEKDVKKMARRKTQRGPKARKR